MTIIVKNAQNIKTYNFEGAMCTRLKDSVYICERWRREQILSQIFSLHNEGNLFVELAIFYKFPGGPPVQ